MLLPRANEDGRQQKIKVLFDGERPEVAGEPLPCRRMASEQTGVVAEEEESAEPVHADMGNDGKSRERGDSEQIKDGWWEDAEDATDVKVAQADGAESLFLGEQAGADEDTADGEEDIDAHLPMEMKPIRIQTPQRMDGVMKDHDGKDGEGAPTVESGQVRGAFAGIRLGACHRGLRHACSGAEDDLIMA